MVTTLENYRTQGRFQLHSFAVMPDHLHLLLTPAPDVSLEKAIQFVKGGFSFRLKSRFAIWGEGHFDKRVPDRFAYDACVAYIEDNPVKAGMVVARSEFPYSSASRPELVDPMPPWFA